MKFEKQRLQPAAWFTGVLALATNGAMAADIYWDQTGTGSWTTASNWHDNAAPGSGDVAFLTNGGEATISDGAVQVNNVYLVDGSLTMTGGSLALQTTADVVGIGTNLSLAQTPGAGPTSASGTLDLTLSNDASFIGRGKLFFGIGFYGGDYGTGSNLATANISLSGTSSIQGSTTNANWVVFAAGGGTANVDLHDNSFIAKAAGGSGNLLFGDGSGTTTTLASATVNAYDSSSLRSSNGVTIATNLGATASVTLHDSSYIQLTTANSGHLIVGENGGTGTLTVNDHAYFTVNDALAVGFATNSIGTLNYSSDATSTVRTAINIGYGNGARGTLNMNAGRIQTTQTNAESYWGGFNSSAVANVSLSGDSTIVSASALAIGADGSKATVNLSGNAEVTFSGTTPRAWFYGNSGDSSLTMSGDSKFTLGNTYLKTGDYGNSLGKNVITLNDNAAFSLAGRITLGHYGNAGSTASLILNDNATFTVNDRIIIGRDDANTDNGINTQVVLHGGTLATKYIEAGGGVSDATKNTIVVNGGTLKALDSGEFFRTTVYNANRTYVKIQSGGLSFDTNGFDVNIQNHLNGDAESTGGGLTKRGEGTLTLHGVNTYTGETVIQQGTLALGAAGSLAASSTIEVQAGAFLDVSAVSGWTVATGQTLSGNGTVIGAATVGGTLGVGHSPGTLTFNDGLTLAGIADFEFTLASLADGSFDLAQGSGQVTFGGVLNLFFDGGESYANGGEIQIFAFDSYSGDFDAVNFSGLGAGQTATFNAANGTVSIIPEPAVALLGGLGLLALLRRRR